jgi:hypothetical protein
MAKSDRDDPKIAAGYGLTEVLRGTIMKRHVKPAKQRRRSNKGSRPFFILAHALGVFLIMDLYKVWNLHGM